MALICTVGPVVEPVTLAEAKLHMRVDLADDDALILGLITAARQHLEAMCRPQLAMLAQTWRLVLDAWPGGDLVELRPWPLRSVSSITYIDTAGVTRTLASTAYQVDTYSAPGRVYALNGWPSTTLRDMAGVTMEFVAGYGETAATLPQPIRQALLLLVAHWYENREMAVVSGAMPKELPFTVSALMAPWRREV